jgi:hypothetical protein
MPRFEERRTSGAKPRMAASWAVIWDSVCDFLHGKSQALSEGSAVKPAIHGSPTYSQSFTARLKSCPDTKQSFPQPGYPLADVLIEKGGRSIRFSAGGSVFDAFCGSGSSLFGLLWMYKCLST